jgi:putative FmdB family regulatory protein
MPTYSYKCRNCDHQFDIRQRFSEDPLTQCPNCEGHIRRVISNVGIVFKGSGFYITDNRNGKANSAVTGNGKKEQKEITVEKKDATDKSKSVPSEKKSDSASTSSAAA